TLEAMPNCSAPINGTTVRSRPTMPPTKALMTTSSVNCFQFFLSPRATSGIRATRFDEHTVESSFPGLSRPLPLFSTGSSSMMHVALLGDSTFDNASYVQPGEDVLTKLRLELRAGPKITLLARDGAQLQDMREQLDRL